VPTCYGARDGAKEAPAKEATVVETARGNWVRTSNLPDCRGCNRIGREWLYKVGFTVITRVNACFRCDDAAKAKAMESVPERYR
jgi:hypothetical protein